MKKIAMLIAAVASLSLAACAKVAVDGSGGAAPACATNADCAQGTLEDQQCGWHPCVDGACVAQYEDAGTPCVTGFKDNDASAPIWGACSADGKCH